MARYVVMLFSDDGQADEFVQAVQRQGGFFFLKSDGHFETANNEATAPKVTVEAMYQRPTLFCDCPPESDPKLVQTKKHSWTVHNKCKKPIRTSFQHPNNLIHVDWSGTPPRRGHRIQYFGFRCSETPIAQAEN